MSKMATFEKKVALNHVKDWATWNRVFITKADDLGLWDAINPEAKHPTEFMKKPVPPTFEEVLRKLKADRIPSEQRVQTRSQTVTTQTVTGQTPAPEESPEPAVLEAEAQKRYATALNECTFFTKLYESERTRITSLRDWMLDTIGPNFSTTALTPGETLRTWYTNLLEVAVDPDIDNRLRRRYREVTTIPTRAPKSWSTWLDSWEDIMSQGRERNISEMTTAGTWVNDFLETVERFFPSWTKSFKIFKEEEVRQNTLSYRTLSHKFREELQSYPPAGRQTAAKGRIAAKGSFAVYEDSGPSDALEGDAPGDETIPKTGSASAKRKRKAFATTGNDDDRCQVCKCRGHELEKCFYAFPDLAYDSWRPRPAIRKVADANLKKKEISDQVSKVKGKKPKVEVVEEQGQD